MSLKSSASRGRIAPRGREDRQDLTPSKAVRSAGVHGVERPRSFVT
jgi:hypothetical protein